MKILVIYDESTPGHDLFYPLEDDHDLIFTNSEDGLRKFITESPDLVFCFVEFGNLGGKFKEQQVLYKNLQQSLVEGQDLVAVGFTEPDEGVSNHLRLPYAEEDLMELFKKLKES